MATDNRLIATRYVKALFDLASQQGTHDAIKKDMLALKAVFQESKEFRQFLISPVIGREESAKVMEQLLSQLGASELTRNFFVLVAHKGRLPTVAAIIDAYLERLAQSRGELEAKVTSAQALSAPQTRTLADAIAKATGKKVAIKVSEDPALIGGLQIRIGSLMLDNSVAGKLQRLRQSLTRAA